MKRMPDELMKAQIRLNYPPNERAVALEIAKLVEPLPEDVRSMASAGWTPDDLRALMVQAFEEGKDDADWWASYDEEYADPGVVG